MKNDPVMLVLISIGVAWQVKMIWLASILSAVGFLMIVSSLTQKPPEKAPAPTTPQEVLTPVIVQDTGKPPYLYPPSMKIKLNPQWSSNSMWEWAGGGLGAAANIVTRTLGGGPGWNQSDVGRFQSVRGRRP